MYYIDTMTQKLDAFDFDGSTGSITNRRCVYNFDKDSNDGNFLGYPDGMTIDSNDTLWIAMWDGWCVYNVDPVQKVIVAKYDIPCQRVTSCAFGGKNLDQLYVTSANCGLRLDVGEEKWLREQKDAGKLFVLDFHGTSVKGVKASRFKFGLSERGMGR